MTDDWTWEDGHADHGDHGDSGYEAPGEHHDLGFDGDDTDPFGSDLSGGLDDAGGGGDDLAGAGVDEPLGWEDASDRDPFAPDALVSDHDDWSAGLDDLSDNGPAAVDPAGLFGVDPDVSAYTDALWPTPEFPAALDLGAVLPEPVDGPPWTDPAELGSLGPAELMPTDAPEPADLAAYAGLDPASSGWAALAGSEDPATAALARFWGPAQE